MTKLDAVAAIQDRINVLRGLQKMPITDPNDWIREHWASTKGRLLSALLAVSRMEFTPEMEQRPCLRIQFSYDTTEYFIIVGEECFTGPMACTNHKEVTSA